MKNIQFIKDKSSVKFYILAVICVACVYSCKLTELFIPLFDNVYYGNLVSVFVNASNLFLWLAEFLTMFFVCKKLNIKIFSTEKKPELKLSRLIILFVVAVIPMFAISAYLNFTVKIVYDLGVKVTILGLLGNVSAMLSWLVKMIFIVMFINFIHQAIEKNIVFKSSILNKWFPWGSIFCFLIFGLIDFFFFSTSLAWFYLILTFLYGIIYLLADRKFSSTYVICYLIWLLWGE